MEAVFVQCERLQCILLILRSGNDLPNLLRADVLKDALELVRSWGFFRHIQVKLLSLGLGLGRVVAGLILSSMRGCVGRGLLENCVHSQRGGSAGLLEESDHIEGLALEQGEPVIISCCLTDTGMRECGTYEAEHVV